MDHHRAVRRAARKSRASTDGVQVQKETRPTSRKPKLSQRRAGGPAKTLSSYVTSSRVRNYAATMEAVNARVVLSSSAFPYVNPRVTGELNENAPRTRTQISHHRDLSRKARCEIAAIA
jgi:hypothetical protein